VTNLMLEDALRELFSETLRSWDAPKYADIAALPLVTEDDITRRVIWGSIRSFGFGIAERAAAGESDDQLRARIDRAIRKIVRQVTE
jgi:hypothetical protein